MNQVDLDKPSPELKAGLISKIFFFWLLPLLKKGTRKELELDDLYPCLPEDSSARLGSLMQRYWKKEVDLSRDTKCRPPKLWRIARALVWKQYLIIGIVWCFDELVLRVSQPIILKEFIKSFNISPHKEEEHYHRRRQFLLAVSLVLISFLHAILMQKVLVASVHVRTKVRIGISNLIFRKIVKLKNVNSEGTNIGKLSNLLSSDVGQCDQAFQLHFLYIGPVQIMIYTYLLWDELGVSSLAGIACIFLVLPILFLSLKYSLSIRLQIAQKIDKRARILNEILGGIRLIKMYAWEKPFTTLISNLRADELKLIQKNLYLHGTYNFVQSVSAKLIPFCALIVYVFWGSGLSPDKAFFAISVFTNMQAVLHRIPNVSSQVMAMLASFQRIESFLLSEQSDSQFNRRIIKSSEDTSKSETFEEPSVTMNCHSASWTESHQTLKNLNVNLKGNKLVIVVGHVAAGKSSFLKAILSELPITSSCGSCVVQGRLTYASQDAWLFPSSIRQNILFGSAMDAKKYWKTIELCGLQEDFDQFPNRDFTLVGDRGVCLSGGQRSRVNLARSIYHEADIYLLDDPLSAVDARVNTHIFHNCIKEHLNGKLRILATHQLQYLPMADHIIVLNRAGEIWRQGAYEELKRNIGEIESLISDKYITQSVDASNSDTVQDKSVGERLHRNGSARVGHAETLKTKDKGNHGDTKLSTKEENKDTGTVSMETYLHYFRFGKSFSTLYALVLTILSYHVMSVFLDYWLAIWTSSISNNSADTNSSNRQDEFYVRIYCILIVVLIVTAIFRSCLYFRHSVMISSNVHNEMLRGIMRTPVKFYDDNPSGRIMNRFTRDLSLIDEQLPLSFLDFVSICLTLFGMIFLNVMANHAAIVPAALFVTGLWRLRQFYVPTATPLKRMEALAKSPVFTHVASTVKGLTTIRALRGENLTVDQFDAIQDSHTAVFYMSCITGRWFGMWLEIVSCIFLACICVGLLLTDSVTQGGKVGIAISSIMGLAGGLQWGVRQSAETEGYMTSVERAIEYCNLKSEESPQKPPTQSSMQRNWPSTARIEFQSVSLAYDDLQQNKVLKRISFSINSHEKVGLVGRTGAGKSSLVTALFRLVEPCEGLILIDGVNIKEFDLQTLRSCISIIPQDPVLFTGTLKYNLDPFNQFGDGQLWRVIEEVELKDAVPSLDFAVADGGSNFSVGQRQLICLARALLRDNKILVMDEATANVDPRTDSLIQKTIRSKFSSCTIITIAHVTSDTFSNKRKRLSTIMDSDRVIVLENGEIREIDSPQKLLKDETTLFHIMAKESGIPGYGEVEEGPETTSSISYPTICRSDS